MGALLALSSAVVYGIVDFAGGLLSRRVHRTAVTFLGQLGGLLLACAAALLLPADAVHLADLLWGALSGVGSGTAMWFLNRGLSRGDMSVVVPVSAVTGVALSVLCGVLVLGDRPGAVAWLGIAVTVPSLWPVAAGRVAAVLVLLPDAARHARRLKLPPVRCVRAVLIGAGAALGLVLYLRAAQRQLLAVAVVLASLYPALPVVLGLALLHERISRRQAVGLLGAGIATVLLTLG